MASSGKKKTTMAKLTRESRLRERRLDKQAKKNARKQAAAHQPGQPSDTLTEAEAGDNSDYVRAITHPDESAARH
jgi:hypothetical protein